jgi:tRNA(Ile2) C34 agmatinyltransferase TiaS
MDSMRRLECSLQSGTVYPVVCRDIYLGHPETQAAARRHASRQLSRHSLEEAPHALHP